jgi:malonate decarboxylase gamma subunit
MAYDVRHFSTLGLLWRLIQVGDPQHPSAQDLALVRQTLLEALDDIERVPFRSRLEAPNRAASAAVRARLREEWQ